MTNGRQTTLLIMPTSIITQEIEFNYTFDKLNKAPSDI